MKKVKIKICGITNLEDALIAQSLGASALGFVFYPNSPRSIKPEHARQIIAQLNKKIKKVGVFVNATIARIKKIAGFCDLDILQFHGNETPEFCRKFPGYKTIRAFRIRDEESLKPIPEYKTDYYLFDTFKRDAFGGTGKQFNWGILKKREIKKPFFLSGGLSPENIKQAVKELQPDWVDVSSGVEAFPGKKDKKLIERFIKSIKALQKNNMKITKHQAPITK